MAAAEGMALVDACFFVLITEILVAFVSNGDFRGLFYFCCIEHGHAAAKSGEHHPHHHTETCAGEDVNAGDSLCYSDRERVHPGGSEADLCCDVRDKHGNDRVVSDSDEQRAEDHGERKGLFSHSEHGSAEGKQDEKNRDQQFFGSFCFTDQADQTGFNGSGADHDTESAADYHQKCDDFDGGAADNSVIHIIEKSGSTVAAEQCNTFCDRFSCSIGQILEASVFDDGTGLFYPVHQVCDILRLVIAFRDEEGHDGRDNYHKKDDNVGIRHVKSPVE